MMNSDTSAALQYLSTLIEVIESRGLVEGSFKAEALSEIVEISRDPDYKGDKRPSGKSIMVITWQWSATNVPQLLMTSEGDEISGLGEHHGR